MTDGIALRVSGLTKSFGSTRALDDVSLQLERGTIHTLLGGNGSGKSTLIKILAGVQLGDRGTIEIGGEQHDATQMTPEVARGAGLHFVHQQSTAFPDLSVAENLQLGRGFDVDRVGRIHWRAVRRRAREVLARFRIDADPEMPLGELSRASQTMVAIARALQDQEDSGEGVLVLDEPTSSLPASEVDVLLAALRRYAESGQTILLVTHRLEEVTAIADRATMLRDGRQVGTVERADLDQDALIELMVGLPVDRERRERGTRTPGEVLLRCRDLRGGKIQDASFEVRAGEIVGVAGLLGSGRSTLLRLLFGLVPRSGGELELAGRPLRAAYPGAAIAAGVAYVPEDRAREAVFAEMTVAENLQMAVIPRYWRHGRFARGAERRDARELMTRFGVKAASERARFASLSGGNQQKAILARWMRRSPRLILLDEPTQGVDVGARLELYDLIRDAAAAGAGTLVVSSELEEIEALCDRALILWQGRIVGQVERADLHADNLERLAHRGGVAT